MTLQSVMSPQEQAELNNVVRNHNLTINQGRNPQQGLGKDDFLKILITQLQYQDPTSPMEDKEFIAQMAQFSTLDQMTSMANDFARLTSMMSGSDALNALGKNVELIANGEFVQGMVMAVTRGANPEILVNGNYYLWEQVARVFEE